MCCRCFFCCSLAFCILYILLFEKNVLFQQMNMVNAFRCVPAILVHNHFSVFFFTPQNNNIKCISSNWNLFLSLNFTFHNNLKYLYSTNGRFNLKQCIQVAFVFTNHLNCTIKCACIFRLLKIAWRDCHWRFYFWPFHRPNVNFRSKQKTSRVYQKKRAREGERKM